MIKATGITAEFDPLHNGHTYLMEQARSLSGCDVIVVAMSGDYVQRGEPSVLDKWTRCDLALGSGADIVAEIPVQFCLADASVYARASVAILEAMSCSQIAFGSECGDIELLKRITTLLESEEEYIKETVSGLLKEGMSYPAARSEAYKRMHRDPDANVRQELDVLKSSNDILGIEYLKNMKQACPLCIKRNRAFISASSIRKILCSEEAHLDMVRNSVPTGTYDVIQKERLTFPNEWSQILRYAAMSTPADHIEDCPSAGEGLSNLIKTAAHRSTSFDEIIMEAKSKRYTYTRLSRLCMQLILGITRDSLAADTPEYVRILGFSEKGREYLSELKKNELCTLPVITNVNKQSDNLERSAASMLELDIHAADIYNLVTGRDVTACSDHVMKPVMK